MNSKYLKLVPNTPIAMKFAEIPPQVSDGQYGPRFNYTVNGSQIFTASQYLSDQIEATLGMLPQGSDRTLTITQRKNAQNKTRYDIEVGAAVPLSATPPRQAPTQAAMRDFASVVNDYASCLFHANLICAGQFGEDNYSNEDVRAVGTTLFIEANRSSMKIPSLYDQDTPVEDDGVLNEDLPFEP